MDDMGGRADYRKCVLATAATPAKQPLGQPGVGPQVTKQSRSKHCGRPIQGHIPAQSRWLFPERLRSRGVVNLTLPIG